MTGKTEPPVGWDFVVVLNSAELWPMLKLVMNNKGRRFFQRWLKLRLFDHKGLESKYIEATKTRTGVKPDVEYASIIRQPAKKPT